jgi:hypothetical protein
MSGSIKCILDIPIYMDYLSIKGVRALLAKSKIWKRALTPLITQP